MVSAFCATILCSWRKSGLSKEKLTWFELSHIAPVIHNELYVEHNQDILKARKSGLLHNDAIEPRPRTMDNLLYESGSDKETETLTKLAASKRYMAQRNRGKDSSSHCFEGERVADKEKKLANLAPFALQPDPLRSYPLPPATVFMPLPPMMSHLPMMPLPPMMPHPPIMPLPPMTPHSNSYMSLPLDAHMKSASSFTSAPGDPHRSSSPHPRSLTRLGQAQSSTRHCITTYTTYTSGIPPHPSSKFLQGLQDANIGNRISGRRTKARGRRSTSTLSQTHSEPTHYPTKSNSTTKVRIILIVHKLLYYHRSLRFPTSQKKRVFHQRTCPNPQATTPQPALSHSGAKTNQVLGRKKTCSRVPPHLFVPEHFLLS